MFELLQESIKAPNLPATVLLIIVIVYWIINLIGIVDSEMFHHHADMDIDGSADHDHSLISKTFDFGDLPITIVFSFFSLFFWMGSIICNYYTGNSSMVFALVIYIPVLIVAFILTKIVAIPLAKGYKFLNDNSEESLGGDFAGSVCTISVEANSNTIGQGDINRNGDSIRIHVKTSEGKVLKKGEQALLIEYFADKGYYLAEPHENLN